MASERFREAKGEISISDLVRQAVVIVVGGTILALILSVLPGVSTTNPGSPIPTTTVAPGDTTPPEPEGRGVSDSFTLTDGTEVERIDLTGDRVPDVYLIDGFEPLPIPPEIREQALWERASASVGALGLSGVLVGFLAFWGGRRSAKDDD